MTPNHPLPLGFRFAGVSCGIKPQTLAYAGPGADLDLALIVSERPCNAAGVFTQNRFPAASVLHNRKALAAAPDAIQAAVINSGNANACTGAQGEADARRMAELVQETLDLPSGSVLVMSTGVIGLPMPMDKIEAGVRKAAAAVRLRAAGRAAADPGTEPPGDASGDWQGHAGLQAAAQAIMTTDTKPKVASRTTGPVTVLGIAKGAAMIHPNMATMLATVLTDAAVAPEVLQAMLRRAVDRSFNAITVDGDTSTNDTVLVLANGMSVTTETTEAADFGEGADLAEGTDWVGFERALTEVCVDLAQQIVRDAEGASKFVTVRVSGVIDEAAARQVAQTIATSVLFKTAVYGGDPNWGRVLAAAGRSGVELDPQRVALWFAGDGGEPLQVVAGGTPLPYLEEEAAAVFACREIDVHLDLGMGQAEATVWTSDLTHEYVTLNARYRT